MSDINLIHGDCLEKLKNIQDKSINLVLIDPPYNIGKDKWDKWKSVDDYVEFMGKVFKEIERILKDNGSFYFFHNDFIQMTKLQLWIEKNTNLQFKQLLIWDKYNGTSAGTQGRNCVYKGQRNYAKCCEYILYYTLQNGTGLDDIMLNINNFQSLRNYSKNLQNFIGLKLKDINKTLGHRRAEHFFYHSSTQWDLCTLEVYQMLINNFNIDNWKNFRSYESLKQEYDELRQKYEKTKYTFNEQGVPSIIQHPPVKQNGHLTPKPVKLLEILIKTSSNENDIVLDCFMGSGSTGVACKHTNRQFIGIEIDKKYFEIAKNRIELE